MRAPTRLPLSWTDEKWGEVEKATEEEVAKTHEEEVEKAKESLEVETTWEEGAEETDNEMGVDAVLVDTLMNKLLAGVTPEMLEKASKTGILFNYELDPKNPNSRKVDREMLKANQTVLSKIVDLGPLTKSVYKRALTAYNAKIGMIIGKTSNTLNDQSWSLKRMTMDVESIKKNSTTCSRLPPWLKSLVELWPLDKETPLKTDVIKEAASPILKRPRSLFRIGSTPESVLRHRSKPSPLEGDTDEDEADGTDKAVSEIDSDKENQSEDESSDKPSKTAKKAKKEEDDDKYKEIGEYLRLNPKMRIDWDPVKKKGLLMTADGMIYSTREMMGPNGFVRCLFEETKHFWDSEIVYFDYEENVVMNKPSIASKGKAPKRIASPKRKPKLAKAETPPTTPKKLAKHETPPKTPKPFKKKGAIYYEGEWIERSTIWKRVHSKAYHSSKTEAMGKGLKEDDVRKAIQKSVELAKHKFDKIFPP